MVTFGNRGSGSWSGRILQSQGTAVMFGITPNAAAIVGKFQVYVAISTGMGMQRTKRDPTTDLYLLFNAWCTGTISSVFTAPCWQTEVNMKKMMRISEKCDFFFPHM